MQSVLSDPRTPEDVSQRTRNQVAALIVDHRDALVRNGFTDAADLNDEQTIQLVEDLRDEAMRTLRVLAALGPNQDFLGDYRHLLGNCRCGPQEHDLVIEESARGHRGRDRRSQHRGPEAEDPSAH